MSIGNHYWCVGQIKILRWEAKEKGIKIPPFRGSVYLDGEQYGVFWGSNIYLESQGCCAYEARWRCIQEFIRANDEDDELHEGCL